MAGCSFGHATPTCSIAGIASTSASGRAAPPKVLAPPEEWSWKTQGGPVIFAPFKADTDYFAADKQWMINLRVVDIDGICAGLTAAGIVVETRAEWDSPEVGRFARLHDPEGNAVELWEAPAD